MAEKASSVHEYVQGEHWSFIATFTFAGVTTGMVVEGQQLTDIKQRGVELIVDGVTTRWFRAGGGVVVSPYLYAGNGVTFRLTPFTTVLDLDSRHYAPLGFAAKIRDVGDFAMLYAITANLDIAELSMWGRFEDGKS